MSSGTSTTARIAAICASERSVVRLSVSAPMRTSARAVAGFETGSITETLACMSAGRNSRRRASAKTSSRPTSAIRTLRTPAAAARRASARPCTICSCPREAAATAPPAGLRAMPEVSQAAFGRAKRLTSTVASRAIAAISASSSVGEHEHARALRGAVHAHLELLAGREQRLEAARPLAARDLDAVARAVGEALGRLGQARGGRRAEGRATRGSCGRSASGRC